MKERRRQKARVMARAYGNQEPKRSCEESVVAVLVVARASGYVAVRMYLWRVLSARPRKLDKERGKSALATPTSRGSLGASTLRSGPVC